jgi:D-lactate dehydrogenase
MRIAVFSARRYERAFFDEAATAHGHGLTYLEYRLTAETASLASGFPAVCLFVNDQGSADALRALVAGGTRLVALRSAGYNHVDITAAQELGMTVAHVPAYSPHAVAEHALALILALNRKTHRAYNRVREGNFSLDGLLGTDLFEKTVGVVGTGRIGGVFAGIMLGIGCTVLAHDPYPDRALTTRGVRYVSLEELLGSSDIISLHCPLTPETHHLLDRSAFERMRDGVTVINTSRGALVDTRAAIAALKTGRIGALGIDVYEEEAGVFFEDYSGRVIQDDVLARLLTFPNALITAHQGFFTREAMVNIAATTIENVTAFERGTGVIHRVPMP